MHLLCRANARAVQTFKLKRSSSSFKLLSLLSPNIDEAAGAEVDLTHSKF